MKKRNAGITLAVFAAVLAVLLYTAFAGWGKTGTGAAHNIRLGLDLEGGVSITYQAVEENPSDEDMADTVYKLRQRVDGYSTEASVYREGKNRISIEIPGKTEKNQYNYNMLSSKSITQSSFLSAIKQELADNTDSLFNVNHVDIIIYVCNEDLNAYISSQASHVVPGQDYQAYTNVQGGVGIFGSRRTHIRVQVPCDSNGREDYLPSQLKNLGVGFYGSFSK